GIGEQRFNRRRSGVEGTPLDGDANLSLELTARPRIHRLRVSDVREMPQSQLPRLFRGTGAEWNDQPHGNETRSRVCFHNPISRLRPASFSRTDEPVSLHSVCCPRKTAGWAPVAPQWPRGGNCRRKGAAQLGLRAALENQR